MGFRVSGFSVEASIRRSQQTVSIVFFYGLLVGTKVKRC